MRTLAISLVTILGLIIASPFIIIGGIFSAIRDCGLFALWFFGNLFGLN